MNDRISSEEKILSRRGFLKLSAQAVASIALAGCMPTNSEPTRSPKETRALEKVFFREKGVTVWVSEIDNLPTRWADSAGNEGTFNKESLSAGIQDLQTDKKRAQSVLISQRVTIQEERVSQPKPEKPIIGELPNDILSKEQLRERGIEIVDSPAVALHIRATAFSQEELLDYFTTGGVNKVRVIIADYPVLHRQAFKDPVYNPVREIIDRIYKPSDWDDPNKRKEDIIRGLQAPRYEPVELSERKIKAAQTITPQEFTQWGLYDTTTGYYLNQGHELSPDTALLFLAFGDRPKQINCLNLIGFKDGTIRPELFTFNLEEGLNLFPARRLDPSQNYPKPENFRLNKVVMSKKTSPAVEPSDKTPGFVTRHEFAHGHRVSNMTNADPKDVWSEYETDIQALRSIEKAHSLFQSGDNSGYYFVLENKKEGYSIIT